MTHRTQNLKLSLVVAGFVAIANPAIAPYGAAAIEFLEAVGLWPGIEPRLVYGENIAQTLHFVASANATISSNPIVRRMSR